MGQLHGPHNDMIYRVSLSLMAEETAGAQAGIDLADSRAGQDLVLRNNGNYGLIAKIGVKERRDFRHILPPDLIGHHRQNLHITLGKSLIGSQDIILQLFRRLAFAGYHDDRRYPEILRHGDIGVELENRPFPEKIRSLDDGVIAFLLHTLVFVDEGFDDAAVRVLEHQSRDFLAGKAKQFFIGIGKAEVFHDHLEMGILFLPSISGDNGLEVAHTALMVENHVDQPQRDDGLPAVGFDGGNIDAFGHCFLPLSFSGGGQRA